MNAFTYLPNQELDTENCGLCRVTDIYTSIRGNELVYELTDDEGSKYFFSESEIILKK